MLEYKLDFLDDDVAAVHFTGKIREDIGAPLTKLMFELQNAKTVRFDFKEVDNMDSLGIRRWNIFLRELESVGQIFFENCSTSVISQINVTPSFLGPAKVRSFYTRYNCPTCNVTSEVLVNAETLPPGEFPEATACPKCQQLMETEELESEYFAFLLRAPC